MSLQEDLHRAHLSRRARFFPSRLQITSADLERRERLLSEREERLRVEEAILARGLEKLGAEKSRLPVRPTQIKNIINAVLAVTGMSEVDILTQRRDRKCVEARHLIFYAARERTTMSFPQIGRQLNRDHTTVMHSCSKIEAALKTDKRIADLVAEIFARVAAA